MSERLREGTLSRIRKLVKDAKGVINISGISEGRAMLVAALIAKERGNQTLIITTSYSKAKKLADDLSFFVGRKVYVIPDEEQLFLRYEAKSHGHLDERLAVLKALLTEEDCIVIAPILGAVKKLAPHKIFQKNLLEFATGNNADLESIKRSLAFMGYERTGFVESKGQYGIRGGILDIFPADSEYPYRIELFDTEIDSIRTFAKLYTCIIKKLIVLYHLFRWINIHGMNIVYGSLCDGIKGSD